MILQQRCDALGLNVSARLSASGQGVYLEDGGETVAVPRDAFFHALDCTEERPGSDPLDTFWGHIRRQMD